MLYSFFTKLAIIIAVLIFSPVFATVEQLPDCNVQPEIERQKTVYRDAIVISTLDGKISLLSNGKLQWSVETGSEELLSSSITRLEMSNNGQVVRLIPALDGNLYKFNGEQLEPVPMSAETLLKSSFRLGDDIIVTGGREVTSYGISLRTGEVRYVCSMKGCSRVEDETTEDVLVVRRQTQTVRAVEPRSGEERWNFSVGEHQVSLLQRLEEGCGRHEEEETTCTDPGGLRFIVPEGFVSSSDGSEFRWSYQFDSPIVHAWHLKDGKLDPIDLFDQPNVGSVTDGSSPLLYLGVHHRQLYVQNSALMKLAIQDTQRRPRLDWKPYLATGDSRTPYLNIGREQPHLLTDSDIEASTAVILKHDDYFDYPFDSGYYLYGSASLLLLNNETVCDPEVEETIDQIIIVSLWHWWKEVLGISIATSVLVNFLITRHVLKRLKRKLMQESSGSEIQIVQASRGEEHEEADHFLEEKELPVVMSSEEPEYRSRYAVDFDPIQCLGKGGFGVVFESKNKIDDCHYAVKRISLPTRQEAREKVMREVKALAKLDHTGIVRYFNAWQECPPSGWQEHMDKGWGYSEVLSPGASSLTKASSSWRPTSRNNPLKVGESNDSFGFVPKVEDQESGSFSCEQSARVPAFQKSESFDIVFGSGEPAGPSAQTGSFAYLEDSGCDDRSSEIEEEEEPRKQERPKELPLAIHSGTPPRLYLYIQMQLCRKETLKDWLCVNRERNRDDVLDIFEQIVGAVQYVHECGLMHRDLKPSNILFSMDWTIKVGDFGLVTATVESEAHTPQSDEVVGRHTNQVGTQLYMSPEQIAGQAYSNKVDIFSLGLILFELLVSFPTQMERVKVMLNVKSRQFPESFSSAYPEECAFVKKLLSHDPAERLSAIDIRQDTLLKDFQPNPQMSARFRRRRTISQRFSSSSDSQD